MPQPTYSELIGAGTVFNEITNKLEIPLDALAGSGLDATQPTALQAYASIVKNAHTWLEVNEDQEVMATSSLSAFSPIERNEVDRTEFSYTVNFYAGYEAPTFDPDEV